MLNAMNVAIVVAAGRGTRFGAEKPKQFLLLDGKPVVFHALQRFQDCTDVDEIVAVLPNGEIAEFKHLLESFDLPKLKNIVAGGETRFDSVLNGLNSLQSENVEIVAVHDGARPLVTVWEISATIEKARETGAACLVAAVTDTIKEISDDNFIQQTIDRTKLRRALTPQCFRAEILRRAFAENSDLTKQATDECYLVEQINQPIAIVEGSARNIKITLPEDLILAETLLREQSKV